MSQLYLTGIIDSWDSQTAKSAFMDTASNVLIAGYITESGRSSALAIKYNARGIAWQQTYPGPFSTQFSDIIQLADGTYVATGTYFTSGSSGDESIWVVNIDADGNNIGSEVIGMPGVSGSGTGVVATADGGFIVTALQLKGNDAATLIVKFDANKTLEWQKTQSGFVCNSIKATAGGTFILSGRNTPGGMNFNPTAILIDRGGNVLMNTTFTKFPIYILQGTDAVQTSDGNFVMVAQSVIIKFTPAGDVIWTRTTTNGKLISIVQLTNGNLAMGGATVVASETQPYVVVTDSEGNNILWDNSELMAGGMISTVFIDSGYDVVWSAGTVYFKETSLIAFAAYNPTTTLEATAGQTKSYAFLE